jgi:hypothetical protein
MVQSFGKYHLRESDFFVLGTELRRENKQIMFGTLDDINQSDRDDNWHLKQGILLPLKDKAKFGLQEPGSLVYGSFEWKDQGWGYNKAGFRLTRNRETVYQGEGAPRPGWGRVDFSFRTGADDTDKLQTSYRCGGGGGHQFHMRNLQFYTIPN